jgi:hypothetical protein
MINGYRKTQDAQGVKTQWVSARMAVKRSRTAAPRPWHQQGLTDLHPRSMAAAAAPRRVDSGEARDRQQRERRKNRLTGVIAALVCFVLCGMASSLIGEAAVGNGQMGTLWGQTAGVGIGWLYTRLAREVGLPGVQRGALCGWITYLLCVPFLLQVS